MIRKLLGIAIIVGLVIAGLLAGVMLDFIFLYPLFMSFIWIIGSIYFYFHWEKNNPGPGTAPTITEHPFVSILIPCFNEGLNVEETIEAASRQNYPEFEIIAINDGSADNTREVLDRLALQYPMLRVVHLARNQGKAMALRMGTLMARGEYLVCIDGDAMLHPNAVAYLVKPMIENPRVGGVTGNPRIRTRSTLLGKTQVGEFSSIIGLIKRAQRIYGQIFTVSGVIAAFRRRALHNCGYWDINMVTEDIDISWKMQLHHWQIQFEPCALVWILMPETLRGLWKQRVRWAQGGAEVFFKNITRIWRWRNRRMWTLVADYALSVAWVYSYVLSLILWAIGHYVPLPAPFNVPTVWPPAFWGMTLATLCLLQCLTALTIDRQYDHKLLRFIGWTIWYPLAFWLVSLFTTMTGFPRAIVKSHATRGAWDTTDRGFQ